MLQPYTYNAKTQRQMRLFARIACFDSRVPLVCPIILARSVGLLSLHLIVTPIYRVMLLFVFFAYVLCPTSLVSFSDREATIGPANMI